jgi:hypothetical protein
MRKRSWVISHHKVEWGGVTGVVLLVVMDKFCKGKMFYPCFRDSTAIDLEIRFQFLIEAFSLSISLRVIGGGRRNGVVEELGKGSREFGNELGAMIRDDLIIESESSIDVLEEEFGYSFQGNCFQTWDNNYPLHKAMVYHDHDRVETPRWRKVSDEIHQEEGEGHSCSGRDRNEGRGHRVRIRFHLLAQGATVNIFMDIGAKTRPPIILFDKFLHFEVARVAHCGMIMKLAEEVVASGRRHISMVFVVQNGINNFPIQQCGLHEWETEAMQCIRGS